MTQMLGLAGTLPKSDGKQVLEGNAIRIFDRI